MTDASYKHSLGIIRSLGARGITVHAVSHHRFAPGFYSQHLAQSHRAPSPEADPEGFCATLRNVIASNHIDQLIPVGYASVAAVCARPDLRKTSIIPGPSLFEHASDKWKMAETALSAGVSAPATALISSVDDATAFLARHPDKGIVIKARRESYGSGATRARTVDECREALSRRRAIADGSGEATIITQEYIEGYAAGYFALAVHGRIVREFMHRRRREWPPEGGASTAAESIHDVALARDGRAILEALSWHGPAMVEFRVNDQGRFLIELNPKFWGSLDLALECGADFPGDICRMAAGEDLTDRPIPEYRIGQKFWWPWGGDMRRLCRRPRDWRLLLDDLLDGDVRSNWRWGDIVPNLIEVGRECASIIR